VMKRVAGYDINIEAPGHVLLGGEKVVGVAMHAKSSTDQSHSGKIEGRRWVSICGAHADAFKLFLRLGRHTCRELNSSY
jgi:hypothetical protein